jgi:hypothetical protein
MAGSTPIYGFPYPESSDLVADYPALGQDLAEDVEAAIAAVPPGGLVHIATESFSAVSSVSLNNVFTSDYENYTINIKYSGSATGNSQMRLRVGGSDHTSSNYSHAVARALSSGTVGSVQAGENQSSWGSIQEIALAGLICVGNYHIGLPFTSDKTSMIGQYGIPNTSTSRAQIRNGHWFSDSAASYDGFTFFPASGTITGTIRVYGYANS